MSLLISAVLASTIVPEVRLDPSPEDPCEQFAPRAESSGNASPEFTQADQVALADLGRDPARAAGSIFSLSPDHKQIAVHVKRANARTNSYCNRLLIVSADGTGNPIEIDRGGAFLHGDFSLRDFPVVRAGYLRSNPLMWSPDGSRIAFLKRSEGSTQAWLADPSGRSPAIQATFLQDDVDRVAWSADGMGLIVVTRPEIRMRAEAIASEARKGFLYDERFSPQFADRPIPVGEIALQHTYVSLTGEGMRGALPSEIALLEQDRPSTIPGDAASYAASTAGHSAWLEPKNPGRLFSQRKLVVTLAAGERRICGTAQCEGLLQLWWGHDGETLFGLQFTGWANNEMALLRWDLKSHRPRQLFRTTDTFAGCLLATSELYCGREGSAQPRRIVAIDLVTGHDRIVFDPNKNLAGKSFGTVRRLRVRTEYGSESFADLVLPPDHKQGQKHPLIVVQYTSHGFLRGGTGDEVPVHPLANRGFAVLSFSRPGMVPAARDALSDEDVMAISRANWADRRNVHSALERAIASALATGTVDATRMGISGFSDGAVTAQWALINSDLFKVAALGSCCEDMNSYPLAAGPRFTRFLRDAGYRFFEPGIEDEWKPISLVLNVENVSAPILIQNADSEYEGGLDVLETFRHRGKAIELYVFEDETHVKWQPAHREAVYQRNADWFSFWLMNRVDCSRDKVAQYERWKALAGAPSPEALQCAPPRSQGP